MRSLRTRLLVGTLVANAVLLSTCALLVFAVVRTELYHECDITLATQARALASLVEQDGTHLTLEYDTEQLPEYTRSDRPDYFCFWTSNGEVLYRSPSLTSGELPHEFARAGQAPNWSDLVLPDGRPGRCASLVFTPRVEATDDDKPAPSIHRVAVTVTVARDVLATQQTLNRLALLLVLVGGAALLVGILLMRALTRHLIRPVERLAGRIAGLGIADLGAHIDDAQVPEELRPVTKRLDDLLARLSSAFTREKAFTADVAHELRTPLAGLRTTVEVTLRRARGPEEYHAVLASCLTLCTQMQVLVDNLLSLARLEAGSVAVALVPCEITSLMSDCWTLCADRASHNAVQVSWTVPSALQAVCDREKLRVVLANLFDNAVSYCDAQGVITVSASAGVDGQSVTLRIANSGCTLTPEQVPQVFGRFWRADPSRSADGGHAGLGLALVRTIVALLQGSISISVDQGMFIVLLTLPAVAPARATSATA